MRKRLLILLVLVLVLLAGGVIAWRAFEMPPVRLVLKYGYPSPMAPTGRTVTVEGVEFVEISPGYFRMGSHFHCEEGNLLGRLCALVGLPWGKQPRHDSAECLPHWVEFAEGFWISKHEVTNEQYERFDPHHHRWSSLEEDAGPVVNVTWNAARRFCVWLGERSGLPVRLPSESEWEAACRAGNWTEFYFGAEEARLHEYAWYDENSGGGTHEVGTKKANAWGLSDFHSNACEWCRDTYTIPTTMALRSMAALGW